MSQPADADQHAVDDMDKPKITPIWGKPYSKLAWSPDTLLNFR